ncbi:Uclacyanin-3 [Capsicum annuum]|jgi:plastocyanin|uniref:Uclacyanin-3 n=1 Tax=Capsicum annuum TaxID=4072 RepID=A0A1U8ED46_CAPAN|nr:uclacyanin-3 [Capsicum annuum]PHT95333.1 Uclacyanin-3 [Capsicum annuum]
MAMSAVATLLFLLVASPVAFAANHVVGGDGGWTQSGDYTTWAAGETFNVGDTLEFNYGGSHGVDVISKDDYDNCNTGNAIKSYNDGKTTIKLSKAGPMYFTCPTFGHCQGGMKLAINVQDSSTPSTPSTPTTPSTPATTPSTPSDSPATPTTPSVGNTPTKSTPTTPNGATGVLGNMNKFVVGVSVVLGALFAFMC